MSMARERAHNRTLHQQMLLKDLQARTYEALSKLPTLLLLPPVEALPGIRFEQRRSEAPNGTIRIEIISRERSLLVFEHRVSLGFEMSPNGEVALLNESTDQD